MVPINHGLVVRRSPAEAHPWLPLTIDRTFLATKDTVAARTQDHPPASHNRHITYQEKGTR